MKTAIQNQHVTEDDVRAAMGQIRWAATKCGRLPPGVTVDDLESVGGEELARLVAEYDPVCGTTFTTFAAPRAKSAMIDHVRKEWDRHRKERHLPADAETGEQLDPSTAQLTPADFRDKPARRKKGTNSFITVSRVEASSPEAAEVARQVAAQQMALVSAFTPDDVAVMMKGVMAKAKKGNLTAAQMVIDLVKPRHGGVTVQTAVVTNPDPEAFEVDEE